MCVREQQTKIGLLEWLVAFYVSIQRPRILSLSRPIALRKAQDTAEQLSLCFIGFILFTYLEVIFRSYLSQCTMQ